MGTDNTPYDMRIDWQRTREVLDCWQVVDTLDQQSLPTKDSTHTKLIQNLEDAEEKIHSRKRPGSAAIYVGSMSRELVSRYFAAAFKVERDEQDATINLDSKREGHICLYSIVVCEGKASAVHVSRLAYAASMMGCKNCRSNLARTDFSDRSEELKKLEEVIKHIVIGNDDSLPLEKLDKNSLSKASKYILGCFDRDLLHQAEESCEGGEKSKARTTLGCQLIDFAKPGEELSFNAAEYLSPMDYFHKDLVAAAEISRGGGFEPKDRYYLLGSYTLGVPTPSEPNVASLAAARFDILNPESDERALLVFYRSSLNAGATPLGAWPSKYPSALLQQVSINRAAQLTNPPKREGNPLPGFSPIMSTNGPPGTGKTTLLKNVVADLVVKKARVLCNLSAEGLVPFKEAFKKNEFKTKTDSSYKRPGKGYFYTFAPQYDRINDYGVLLCSSNNNAVANISKEWGLASELLKDLLDEPDPQANPQLQILQKFNLSNASEFFNGDKPDLFFGEDEVPAYVDEDGNNHPAHAATWALMGATLGKRANRKKFFNGHFQDVLKQVGTVNNLNAFKSAAKRFKQLYDELERAQKALSPLASSTPEELELRLKLSQLQRQQRFEADREEQRKKLKAELDRLEGSFFSWRKKDEINKKRDELRELNSRKLPEGETAAIKKVHKAVSAYGLPSTIDDAYLREALLPMAANRAKVHTSSPVSLKELDAKRQKLFILALQVIRQFFLASPQMRDNLELLNFFETPTCSKAFKDRRQAGEALWQTLLLLIPVVSTTFHSVSSMFGSNPINRDGRPKRGRAPFGLLVVDEAGQAPAYMAVGALSRCRSAMIVGDPKQIRPIPRPGIDDVESAVASSFNVLADVGESVQTLADAQNPYGAMVGGMWMGSPLLVHRRCLSPMFDISNELSYSGLMIQATKAKDDHPPYLYEESRWIDVPGATSHLQVVDEQVEKVAELVRKHLELQSASPTKTSRLYVISPFKAVAEAVQKKMKEIDENQNAYGQELLHYLPKKYSKDADPYIGTVHTFQGKEADEVILVLGCDRRRIGAADWVESDESILNVAVSRARARLYVIGDISTWEHTTRRTVAEHVYGHLAKDQVEHALEPLEHNGSISASGAEAITQAVPIRPFPNDEESNGTPVEPSETQGSSLVDSYLAEWFSPALAKANSDAYVRACTSYDSLDAVESHLLSADEDRGQVMHAVKEFKRFLLSDWLMRHAADSVAEETFVGDACHRLGLVAEWYLSRAYRKTLPACMKKINPKVSVKRITLGTPGRLLGLPEAAVSFAQLTRSAAKNGTNPNAAIANQPLEKWWKGFADEAKIVAKVRNDANHTRLDELTVDDYEQMRHAVFFDKPAGPDSNLGSFFTEEAIPHTLRENLDQLGSLPLTQARPVRFSQNPKDGVEPRIINTSEHREPRPARIVEKAAQASRSANRRPEPSEYVSLSMYISELMNEELMQGPRPSPRLLNKVLGAQGYIKTEDTKLPTEKGRSIGLGTRSGISEKTGDPYTVAGYPLPPSEPVLSVVLEAVRQVQSRK